MKLTIEQNNLQSLLAKVIGAVSKKNTIPILANVKLVATDRLQATTTDLDMEITVTTDATVTGNGETTVNAELFKGIAEKLPKGSLVQLEVKEGYLHVKAGQGKFKLATLNAADYPVMASSEYDSTLNFHGIELRNAFDKTAWAASTEETRYYLNGVAMQHRKGNANFVATDGHRLAWYVDDVEVPEFADVIIPSPAVRQFRALLDDGDATLDLSQTKVRLTFGDVVIVSKVIDGTYPDWTRIIPTDNSNFVTMPSVEAKSAVERVSLVATERTKAVVLHVADGELTFSVRDNTGGMASEVLKVAQDGVNQDLGINSKYVLDAFSQADKGAVTIKYKGPVDAMIIKYDKEPNLTVVTMPMRA